jgi:hypothetical protein
MNHKLFITGATAALTLSLLAGWRFLRPVTSDQPDSAGLVCAEKIHDFGKLFRPAPAELRRPFVIKNLTPRRQTISVAARSCQCTDAVLEKDTLDPGEVTTLTLIWNVPAQLGVHVGSVLVQNADASLRLSCSVRAQVLDILRVEPDQLDFGSLKPGETVTRELRVRTSPGETFAPDAPLTLLHAPPELVATLTSRQDDQLLFRLALQGKAGLGHTENTVELNTGNPAQPSITVPVQATHLDILAAEPGAVTFAPMDAEKSIMLTALTNQPWDVRRVEIDHPDAIEVVLPEVTTGKISYAITLKCLRRPALGQSGGIRLFNSAQKEPLLLRYLVVGN